MKQEKEKRRLLFGILSLAAVCHMASAQTDQSTGRALMEHNPRLSNFPVIEFRRYTIKEGQRTAFTNYFDTYFPEALQQLETNVAGSLLERQNHSGFIWIRGFHTFDDRAGLNGLFYAGSVWNEHKKTINDLIDNADNVLLLRPLNPERGVVVLPAVDSVTEPDGAKGIVIAQMFSVKENSVDNFAKQAETSFASHRAAGAREAGILVTFDVKNKFPILPFRTDGPFLVWLGIFKDNQMLYGFTPMAERILPTFTATGLLKSKPELIVLDPTPRSRLRWLHRRFESPSEELEIIGLRGLRLDLLFASSSHEVVLASSTTTKRTKKRTDPKECL
jgi:hypothetical protein